MSAYSIARPGGDPLNTSGPSCLNPTVIVVIGEDVYLKTTWTSSDPACPDPVIVKTKRLPGQSVDAWFTQHEFDVNDQLQRCPC